MGRPRANSLDITTRLRYGIGRDTSTGTPAVDNAAMQEIESFAR